MASLYNTRLQRLYENTRKSLNIDTNARVVGPSKTTTYSMNISFRTSRNKWIISKRYSEFFKLRKTLRSFLKQHRRVLLDEACIPLQALEESMNAAFPRRHFRVDTPAIIEERKLALERFVQLLVTLIASIPLAESPSPSSDARTKCIGVLYTILCAFLEYPTTQIESETRLKLAVLSLEDVVVHPDCKTIAETEHRNSECCSICISDWHDVECTGMKVVKLPCSHTFHEDCLMEWLQANTICPMCRTDPSCLKMS